MSKFFTLWTEPQHSKLRAEANKLAKENRLSHYTPDFEKRACETQFFCGICLSYRNVSPELLWIIKDPDAHFREGEVLKCMNCPIPPNSRILPENNEAKEFIIVDEKWVKTAMPLSFAIYNPDGDYYVPMHNTRYDDWADWSACSRVNWRWDPYPQIKQSLFTVLYVWLAREERNATHPPPPL